LSQSVRNDCVLKGRLRAPIGQYTPFKCADVGAICPAFAVGMPSRMKERECRNGGVWGVEAKARVGNGKERHPGVIRIGYQNVEETGASDKRARPECDKLNRKR